MPRIIAFGDIHMDAEAARDIPAVAEAEILILTGDLTHFGGAREARKMIELLRGLNPSLAAVSGNLDHPDVETYLEKENISLHGRGKKIGDVGLFGVGGSNPTPFNTPQEFEEDELARLIATGYETVKDCPFTIFVSHSPPHGTNADRISAGVHVGSNAVRRFIEEFQPHVCLTGHIHEARGTDKIGKTIIINPGMLRDGGWIDIGVEAGSIRAQLKNTFAND